MNEHYVCVKVDREERPDVDALCMEAVQAMTGHGGWPLHAFLTPDGVPFYGGTYFPPVPRHGMPAWRQVLAAVAEAWRDRREEIIAQGGRVVERLAGGARLEPSQQPLDPRAPDTAEVVLNRQFDAAWGGWNASAPKFPAASIIEWLLARGERQMSVTTLHAMRTGGIYDQVGGGFARYAVDRTWTVPHFEKMLYDNALLARAYLHGFVATGDERLRRTCEETLAWLARDLRAEDGGFMSALDADSEGVEGKFYVWSLGELRAILDADAPAAIAWFGATNEGNFEGENVLEARGPEPTAEVRERIRAELLRARERRVPPGLDDKRITAWNALAIAAFADAGAVLERPDLVATAAGAADFVLRELRAPGADGRLLRSYNRGRAQVGGFLEDHAFLLEALLTLYEATFDPRWFAEARALGDVLLRDFADPERGGFFTTPHDAEALAARRKDLEDQPTPSGGSSAALGLLRLAALSGEGAYEDAATGHLRLLHELAPRHPAAFGHLLQALAFVHGPRREVALAGDPAGVAELARVVRGRLRPGVVLAARVDGAGDGAGVPLLEGREPVDGRAAAYVCEGFSCRRPVTTAAELAEALG
jgi:hypothetical protein